LGASSFYFSPNFGCIHVMNTPTPVTPGMRNSLAGEVHASRHVSIANLTKLELVLRPTFAAHAGAGFEPATCGLERRRRGLILLAKSGYRCAFVTHSCRAHQKD
jgi:hypothetical protein